MSRALSIVAFVPLPYLSEGRLTAQTGVTIFYAELLPRLAALGHRVHVLTEMPPAGGGESRTGLEWNVPGLSVQWFAFEYWPGRRPLDEEYRTRIAPAVLQLARDQVDIARPDVVLIGREIVAPAAIDACVALGLPSLLVAHGVTTAALMRDDYPAASTQLVLDAIRHTDQVIAVAHHLEVALRELAVEQITTIGNITDPARFRPAGADPGLRAALRIAPASPVVGHASNLSDHKRVIDIVEAAPSVLCEHPDTIFLIIGDGTERVALERRIGALQLEASFRFLGEVEHARMPDYLNQCDLVVMPSERETMSLAYREAQACGCVLIASDIAAAREAIVDGKTGVLFPKGDRSALAGRILELLTNRGRRQRIASAARAKAEVDSPFEWVRAYDAVLQRTVSSFRSPLPPKCGRG